MFENRLKLFTLVGFEVRLDPSWLIIAALVTWSLAAGLFPTLYPDQTSSTYWIMGGAGALGLFASIIVHEFSHSVVARRFHLPMNGITLFIFGGVSEMNDEPPSPLSEFLMAVAGPLTSLILSFLFFFVTAMGNSHSWPKPVLGVLNYLFIINAALTIFNLLPAFPLDGGRMLRAALWGWKKNLRWATRIAAALGTGLSLALIVWGLASLFTGFFISGLWLILIGWFLQTSARASYRQVISRELLKGEPVARFMHTNPVTVPPSLSVLSLVNDYILRYHFRLFPVLEAGKLVSCITTEQVKALPREEWPVKSVRDLAKTCSPDTVISLEADAVDALARMRATGNSRLIVVNRDRLAGIITLKDLLEFLAMKLELEG